MDENEIYDGYTNAASPSDDNGLTMEDLLRTRQLIAETAERTMDKMVTDLFTAPALPKIKMDMTLHEPNPRSFMLAPLAPSINIIESEFCVLEVTKMRVRKKRFWEKFWASLSHWAYTPVEFYTVWEPAAFALGQRNTIYCHPSLAVQVRRKLAEF